jgi:hypothetical protein
MSAVNSVKSKSNCNAVNSGSFNNQVSNNSSSTLVESSTAATTTTTSVKTSSFNYGTKLNQSLNNNNTSNNNNNKLDTTKLLPANKVHSIVNESSSNASTNFQSQNIISSDVQKVLKQEQELQKQIYSANVAPHWLRVNHNNKVIYIR